MRLNIAFLSCVLTIAVLASCKTKETGQKQESISSENKLSKTVYFDFLSEKDTVVYLSTSPCFGVCPVIEMTILNNFEAYYIGHRNSAFEGKGSLKLKPELIDSIYNKAEEIDFFMLNGLYDGPVTDLPTTTIKLQKSEGEKVVKSRFNVPEKLKSYNKWLINIAETQKWESVN